MTEVVSVDREGPAAAREALERTVGSGGVVIFPADTLYGLACDPLNETAVERIHALKDRDWGKPAAVMYFNPLAMRELIETMGPRTRAAVGALLPGPFTLVIENPQRRYPLACGDTPERLGIRLIEGPLVGAMTPVLQTSANVSGEDPPSGFDEIDPEILAVADLAIDGGGVRGEPSTVIDLGELEETGDWSLLREGAFSVAEVAARLDLD